MTTQPSNRVLLMGLPATGKTSFLAALWYLVQHRQIVSRLRLFHLEGDNRYLNQISQAWAAYEQVPHTQIDAETEVLMLLKDATERTLALAFPDLSGESFNLQWTMRQYTQGYDKFLRTASGGILFITPLKYRKPIRIDMANPIIEEIAGGEVKQEPLQNDLSAPPKPWNPEKSPTQVELVELLQFISNREYFKGPFRLVVIISAWDRLANFNASPFEWLADTFPLLSQFLESNKSAFETVIYGVSAQGGDYSQLAALAEKIPSERIQVIGPDVGNPHDLTEPLVWLIR